MLYSRDLLKGHGYFINGIDIYFLTLKVNIMRKIYLVFALLLTLGKSDYASTILITVEDFEFDPAVITVNVGDTILWIWDEGVHTTTSTLIPSGVTTWNAPIDQGNPAFMYVISQPGSYDYECIYHSTMGMVGHITALDPTGVPVLVKNGTGLDYNFTSEKLQFSFENAGSWRIEVYDVRGNSAKSLGYVSSGNSHVEFSIEDLAQGIYIVKMTDGKSEFSGKLIKE